MSNKTNEIIDEMKQEHMEEISRGQIENDFKNLPSKPFYEDWTEEEKFVVKKKMFLFCRDHNLMDLYYQFHPEEEETADEPDQIKKLIAKKKMLKINLGNEIEVLKKKLI